MRARDPRQNGNLQVPLAEGGRQKAEGGRRKAEAGRREAEGSRRKCISFFAFTCFLRTAYCVLRSAFCLLPSRGVLMRIECVELREIHLPLVHYFETSFGRTYQRKI